jgi:hypothetical protein
VSVILGKKLGLCNNGVKVWNKKNIPEDATDFEIHAAVLSLAKCQNALYAV